MPLTQNPHRCKTDSIANPGSILFRVPLVWGGAMHLPAAQQKDFVNPSPRTASSSSSRTAHHPLLGQALYGTTMTTSGSFWGPRNSGFSLLGSTDLLCARRKLGFLFGGVFRFEASFIWRHHRHLSLLEHSAARCKSVDLFDLAAR